METRTNSKMSLYAVVVVIACVAVLLPLFALVPFARPSADDFSYSILVHEAFQQTDGNPLAVLSAAIQTSAEYYNGWQGLYTSAFVLALQPGVAGTVFYPIGVALMLASVIVPCLYFAFVVERRLLRLETSLWVPVGVVAATYILQCMPAMNQAIYWYNGAANYTPWMFACLLTSGLSITALVSRGRTKRSRAIVWACLLSLVMGGTNYMPAFLNIMLMFGFACLGVARKRPLNVAPLLFALGGFALSATAPGTAIRQSFFPDHPGVVSTVAHSIWQGLQDIHAFSDLTLLAAFVAITPFLVLWAKRTRIALSLRVWVASAIAAFILMVGLLCVPFYSMGDFGTNRTYAPVFDLFAVEALFLYGYGVCLLVRNDDVRAIATSLAGKCNRAAACAIGIACVLLIALFGSVQAGHGNSFTAVKHLAGGQAAEYAAQYDAREAEMLAHTGEVVEVAPLTAKPELLFFADIVNEEEDWSSAIAQYYGLQGVVCK